MIPAAFDYLRPATLDEAIALLELHGADAKVLAGGHSLVPVMKLRLAQPKTVIDISSVADLSYVREQGDKIAIGAMTTHYDIEASPLLRDTCPLLTELAPQIARNSGSPKIASANLFVTNGIASLIKNRA